MKPASSMQPMADWYLSRSGVLSPNRLIHQ